MKTESESHSTCGGLPADKTDGAVWQVPGKLSSSTEPSGTVWSSRSAYQSSEPPADAAEAQRHPPVQPPGAGRTA